MYHICHLDRFSFVIDIILSKLFQKVSEFVSFDTGVFRWIVLMEKPTSGIVSSIFWIAVYFVAILWRQYGGLFPSNQIRRVCGENRTRLWKDDVIGHVCGIRHVCGTGHACESYIYKALNDLECRKGTSELKIIVRRS